ncbi:prephenate dehydrogenase [Pelodictyon phaeoclathratiforme]|jgi:prephenate dehydrogenase|uniref:Prephenate dehydrogenase n=1 Tax=Pelodictyon phaeoclathratiforme (strain DSM 5477 / BU-1) TaxID=324925 RepID=B4SGW8_PELPB|nr:prephenate dehydrogenase [Pelodictyon phaeoclathratiforme]ACF44956.1 Prephenate dehydrogenase [Pelodictyon phaeoclathratiforme BU-1]MBV5288694.1 prephenate dehydrogenase [Pelodictyon phaeoclathratiforme]
MSVDSPIRSISFIGLGLLGMSLLQAIKRSPLALESDIFFQGFDPNFSDGDRESVESLGVDRFTDDKKTLYQADLIILSAPVEINIALLDEISQLAPPTTLVSDVSSTKSLIARRARELGLPFLGMHPMAGKEQQGYRESNAELLQGRRIILCDDNNLLAGDKAAFLVALLESAGCTTLLMTPEEHDRVIAKISHLPQLLSTLLMTWCGDSISKSGPGFATLARLAGSSWDIWRDIIATNSDNIADELERFSRELDLLSHEVRKHDLEQLESRFNEANRLYQTLKEMNRP